MPMPQRYSFTRYLSAKRTVDDRALNHQVWQRLLALLATVSASRPVHLLELGAGIGSMAERLVCAHVLQQAAYTAIDADPDTGMRVTRDSEASVRYSESVNWRKSSFSLQRTDRYGIVGQEPDHFQLDA